MTMTTMMTTTAAAILCSTAMKAVMPSKCSRTTAARASTVEEDVDDHGVITDDSDCERLEIAPGIGAECTITKHAIL